MNVPREALGCPKCGRNLHPEVMVCLWDGKSYCRSCVRDVSSHLLAAVEHSGVLSEQISVAPRDAVRDQLRLWAVMGPLIIVGMLCCAAANGQPFRDVVVLALVILVPAIALTTFGGWRNAASVRGAIEVKDGNLTVWHPVYGKVEWRLSDCRWYLGNVRAASSFIPRGVYLRRKIVVIECPLNLGKLPFTIWERVPCGLTPQTRIIWEAFLKLADVQQKPKPWCIGLGMIRFGALRRDGKST